MFTRGGRARGRAPLFGAAENAEAARVFARTTSREIPVVAARSASKRPLTSTFEPGYERREKQEGKERKARDVAARNIRTKQRRERIALPWGGRGAAMPPRDASR